MILIQYFINFCGKKEQLNNHCLIRSFDKAFPVPQSFLHSLDVIRSLLLYLIILISYGIPLFLTICNFLPFHL